MYYNKRDLLKIRFQTLQDLSKEKLFEDDSDEMQYKALQYQHALHEHVDGRRPNEVYVYRRLVHPEVDDLVLAIRKMGGINVSEKEPQWRGKLKQFDGHGFNWPSIEQTKKNKGLSLDDLAGNLVDLGYLKTRSVKELEGYLNDYLDGYVWYSAYVEEDVYNKAQEGHEPV